MDTCGGKAGGTVVTTLTAGVRVGADLQLARVQVVDQRLVAVGPRLGVGSEPAGHGVTLPAVARHGDRIVTSIAEARGDQAV